ncbi:MAG: cytochrome c3 family protein, partial [Melioribacteraceae bacterium]|nr:cytochrome c3 family protein [Melioribacteraceae bacterium]
MLRTLLFLLLSFVFSANLFSQDFDCSDCHEVEIKGVHLEAVSCSDCHSDIVDEDHEDKVIKVNCLDCHDEYEASVKNDIHHKLKKQISGKPTCKSCHGTHTIISPAKFKSPTKQYCGKCHTNGKIQLVGNYHATSLNEETCFDCHDSEEYKPELSISVHSPLSCVDCHGYVARNIEEHQDGLVKNNKANCYSCHNDVSKIHAESIHGLTLAGGEEDAAMCWNCHGSHNILSANDSLSTTNPINIGKTCGTCHDDPEFEDKFNMSVKLPGKMYSESVHGKYVMSGQKGAANCTSCHGSHAIKNRVQDGSQISSTNIPNTCGKCHAEIVEEFKNSIHWIRASKGIKEAPVCNDCHNEHNIVGVHSGNEKEYQLKMQANTCISCHDDNQMNQKFGNSGNEVSQYLSSYHGLASTRGGNNAALCTDCHGVHNIIPSSFQQSTVSATNVTETCRKCHADATEQFSKSYSHETESEEAKIVEDIVRDVYFWLIVVVIGGMAIHNFIIFLFEIRRKRRKEKNVITIPRFTRNEIIQHFLLLTSFITLAITGFALKYPNSFWSEGLFTLGMNEVVRALIHRIAAVIMTVLSFYHVFYLLFTARGRNVLVEMLPTFRDLRDVIDNMLYYLRITKKHPYFNQYDYAEKAEYWALIWGTFVMGATGLVLWFPTIVDTWAPVWLIKVSEIIHFYEAILATLAIIVWHWFFVLIHPKEYPMSFTWIDGKMSIGHYRD